MDTNTRGALADRNFFLAQPIVVENVVDDEIHEKPYPKPLPRVCTDITPKSKNLESGKCH